jgi:hypothetical protein
MSVVSVPIMKMAATEFRSPAMPYSTSVKVTLETTWNGSVAVTWGGGAGGAARCGGVRG